MNSNFLKTNFNSSPSLKTLRNGKKIVPIEPKRAKPSLSSKSVDKVVETNELAEISAITTSLAVLSTCDKLSLDDFLTKNNIDEHIDDFKKNKINSINIVNIFYL